MKSAPYVDDIKSRIIKKLSNAASVFGEQKRLEPMSPDRKARWKKEIDWLLCVTDHIVEFVPSQQQTNGVNMEVLRYFSCSLFL